MKFTGSDAAGLLRHGSEEFESVAVLPVSVLGVGPGGRACFKLVPSWLWAGCDYPTCPDFPHSINGTCDMNESMYGTIDVMSARLMAVLCLSHDQRQTHDNTNFL